MIARQIVLLGTLVTQAEYASKPEQFKDAASSASRRPGSA